MKILLFACSFLFLIGIHQVDAATETIKIYSHESDGAIVTGPYPSSWTTQYFSTIGRDLGLPANRSVAYTDEFNSSQGYIGIHRSFLSFDTSVIPDNAVVISATMRVIPDFAADEYNDQYSYMNVLQGFQASPTVLTFDDIEKCGDTLENPTKGAGDVDISGIIPNEDLLFSLNETGKSWVSKTGYTQLCIREGHDIENKETINNANYWRESGIGHFTSEAIGTSTDPYLEVTYDVPTVVDDDEGDEDGENCKEDTRFTHNTHYIFFEKQHGKHHGKSECVSKNEHGKGKEKEHERFIRKNTHKEGKR